MGHSTSSTSNRPSTEVTCTKCGAQATVPFTPTPGRPVYCRACFSQKQSAPGPLAGPRGYRGGASSYAPPAVRAPPMRKMLSQRRKGHFIYDALQVLEREGLMDETQRRAFAEQVFTRGARQTTRAAVEYVHEKADEKVITQDGAEALAHLVERYSKRQ